MGWRFRKGFGRGPLRATLSERGVGASVGLGRLRFGISPDGRRYMSLAIPGTGKMLLVSGPCLVRDAVRLAGESIAPVEQHPIELWTSTSPRSSRPVRRRELTGPATARRVPGSGRRTRPSAPPRAACALAPRGTADRFAGA